jgi:hypothetical protein
MENAAWRWHSSAAGGGKFREEEFYYCRDCVFFFQMSPLHYILKPASYNF